MNAKFSRQAEKFSAARRMLMVPHSKDEDEVFAHVFHECSLGLYRFDVGLVEYDEARRWIQTVQQTMDTTGLSDPGGEEGLYKVKAARLTYEQKCEFSSAVDELADYFKDPSE